MKSDLIGRPLLLASMSLIVGISSAEHPLNLLALPILLAICRLRLSPSLWISGSVLLGLLLAPAHVNFQVQKGEWTGAGTISTIPDVGTTSERFNLQTDDATYSVRLKGRQPLGLGDSVLLHGVLMPIQSQESMALADQGFAGVLVCPQNGVTVLRKGSRWFEIAASVRDSFTNSVDKTLPVRQASIVDALCFAATGAISSKTRNDLGRVGAAHILSASGLQVFLLAIFLHALLSSLPIRREWQIAIIVAAIAFYASASGLHPATIRAGMMATIAMVAYLFKREPDFLSALGLAAIITVIWQPWTIYTPGFQLSYITVGALSLYWKPFAEKTGSKFWDRILSRVWLLLRMSFIATLAAGPLSGYHFGVVSLVSPISNLLIGVVTPVVIVLSLIAWGFGFLLPPVQIGLLKFAVGPLAAWVGIVAEVLGRQAWSSVQWPPFNAYWLLLYYVGFVLLRNGLAARKS